jgi:Ca2+-binding RTX toxin-like protein
VPINISSNFIVESDEVYTSTSGATFAASLVMGAIEFINYGTIRATGSGATAFSSYLSHGLLHNVGVIEVQSTDTAYGFSSPQWMADIRNTGRITVSGANAYGVYSWSVGQVFDNSGTLTVTGTNNAAGLYLINGGKVSNTGSITVHGGASATGVYIDRFEGGVFENKGNIIVDATGQSYGLVVSGLDQAVPAPNIINRGVITADIAIYARDGGYSPPQPTIENVANYGVVNGHIVLGAGADILRNYNVINGDVDMGSGADLVDLTGGWINGVIDLGEDDDTAIGSAGADVFFGYLGRDTIRGAGGDDRIDGEQGNDTLFGGDGNDLIYGGSGSDMISGDDGYDTIEGGTGDDNIDGGAGTDTAVYAGAATDFTITTVNGVTTVTSTTTGTDTLRNVERLQFTDRVVILSDAPPPPSTTMGTAIGEVLRGGAGVDTLYGLAGDDTLYGEAGDDVLIGGAGTDVMIGGAGNDIYEVTDAGDLVTEAPGEGADIVFSYLGSYALTANAESLRLVGVAGEAYGNALDNLLVGNAQDNRIIGGAGNDTMMGGAGNDAYEVTEAGDVVIENTNEGVDTVYSYVDSYALSANVENLALIGNAREAYGNALANLLIGNAQDNRMIGGAGNDTLIGGAGNDAYEVTEAGDAIIENAGEGIDTVYSYVDAYQLAANVEVLNLVGPARMGLGNAGNNTLIGNALANVLNGNGGDDVLTGGAGADTFWHLGAAAGNDRITDFQTASEVIVLDASAYANFAAVQSHAAQVGGNVVITLNASTSLTLENVQLNQLSAGNFVFFAAGAGEPVDKAQAPLTSAIEHGTDAALTSPQETGAGLRIANGESSDDVFATVVGGHGDVPLHLLAGETLPFSTFGDAPWTLPHNHGHWG